MDYKKLNRNGCPKPTSQASAQFGRHLFFFFLWKVFQASVYANHPSVSIWVPTLGHLPLITLLNREHHTEPRTRWARSVESAVFLSSLHRGQVGEVLNGMRPWFGSLGIPRGFKATFPASEQRVFDRSLYALVELAGAKSTLFTGLVGAHLRRNC